MPLNKKGLFSFLVTLLLATPITAYAHVKWFAQVEPEKVPMEEILSPFFITFAIIVAVILAILSQVMDYFLKIPYAAKVDHFFKWNSKIFTLYFKIWNSPCIYYTNYFWNNVCPP